MPVDFLTAEQTQQYGRFAGDPSPAQLGKYFFLDNQDRNEVCIRRGAHNRLGYALQLCTVRFLGTFLADPLAVPRLVVHHLARQLEIDDASCLSQYVERRHTPLEHAQEIRQRHGYGDFGEQPEHWRLVRWLYRRAWLTAERPVVLFDLATARLVERRILLPGATTLARLVATVRDRAAGRLWRTLAEIPSSEQRQQLGTLLAIQEQGHSSLLEELRQPAVNVSAPGMVDALHRLSRFRDLGLTALNLSRVPPGRLRALARYAAAARSQSIAHMQPGRRTATLLAFAHVYEGEAQDDAVDLLHQLLAASLRRAERKGEVGRLETMGDLDAAALRLRDAVRIVLDPSYADGAVRAAIFALISRPQLEQDVHTVGKLSRAEEEGRYYEHLLNGYTQVRRFLPTLLSSIAFEASTAGQPVLRALSFLREAEGKDWLAEKAPREVITKAWEKLVFQGAAQPDKKFYTLCTLERLQDGLHRRDIYLTRSERWGNPLAKLLQGPAWESVRSAVCSTLNRQPTPEGEIQALERQLEEAYRRAAASIENGSDARIERVKNRDRLCVSPLDKLDEPDSLILLRERVHALIPQVDLPDALLEIHGLTGFADQFTHISDTQAQVENLSLSVCGALLAQACNTTLEPVVQNDVPALTYARLVWVQQNHIRAETIARANARLVKAQSQIPLTKVWGGGEVASADGLRFVVPVRSLNAGHNGKYFNEQRGVTYYEFMNNQFAGIQGIVIPGTLGESAYLLDGLMEQQTPLQPQQLITDTAGYSDLMFGLFWLLGFQFSPRLADLGDTRLWRLDREVHYGVLNGVARHMLHRDWLTQHWDDFLRVAGSLKMGMVKPSELVRSLQRGRSVATLGRAIGELGRISKTLHVLNVIADPGYRRHSLLQLNRHEGRNGLSRRVFHGQRGELRQRYREGQEDQLGALGLVVNALILWTTRYMDAAVQQLRSDGCEVKPEDVARLSPLTSKHFHMLGRYHFHASEAVLRGELRPLRDPEKMDDELLIA